MSTLLSYRRIHVTSSTLDIISTIISQNPQDNRSELSRKICRRMQWIQPNGYLRDMVCRSLLLRLESAGYIKLPPRQNVPQQWRNTKRNVREFSIDTTNITATVRSIQPLRIAQVRRSPDEKLYEYLVRRYHYLGYCQPVGEHLKYVVYYRNRPLACFAFSSAPRHIGCRDRFIGWDQKKRQSNIHLLAYNTRFLILPWVTIPHLASHLLSRLCRRISEDWSCVYNHPLFFLETFVDTERFLGTCYKAANWLYLGLTTGRGKNDHTYKQNRSIKAVWGYPLCDDFRTRLCHVHE